MMKRDRTTMKSFRGFQNVIIFLLIFAHASLSLDITTMGMIYASNSARDDHFGYLISVSGNTLVVGAPGEDSSATGVNGEQFSNDASNSGAAYVFVLDGDKITQQAYLKASNTNSGDLFGFGVGVAGDTIVVGAPLEDSNDTEINGNEKDNSAPDSGAAYVFVRNETVWTQQAYLKSNCSKPGDSFGWSVSISGDTIVVGAEGVDIPISENNTLMNAGAAYVFVRNGVDWLLEAYLKPSNPGGGDLFGCSVMISGDLIVIGAINEDSAAKEVNGNGDDDSALNSGAAYVFARNDGSWNQEAYLKANNADAGDFFGCSVGISGELVVVGALYQHAAKEVNGTPTVGEGAAYVFARNGNTWVQEGFLKADNADAADSFGWGVDIFNNIVVVGAYLESSASTSDGEDNSAGGAGAVYVFVRNGNTWTQEAYLKEPIPAKQRYFGYSVSIDGDLIAGGAPSYAPAETVTIFSITPARNTGTTGEITTGDTSSGSTGSTTATTASVGTSGDVQTSVTTETIMISQPSDNSESGDVVGVAVGVTVGSVVLIVIVVLSVFILRRNREPVDLPEVTPPPTPPPPTRSRAGTITEIVPIRGSSSDHVFSNITKLKRLGSGNFGDVYLGEWNNTQVALKKLKKENQTEEFAREANTLAKLRHPNIVHYYGVYTSLDETQYIVLEYLSRGSVLDVLRRDFEILKLTELVEMALGAASGMAYLESQNVLHRDLSARNLLVTKVDERYVVKVSDFGLSIQTDYTPSTTKIPIRWTSPEVLAGRPFTQKADVWSYGVTLWEILSGGALPYAWLSNAEVVQEARRGNISLSKPDRATDELYNIITDCTSLNPEERPSFHEICDNLKNIETILQNGGQDPPQTDVFYLESPRDSPESESNAYNTYDQPKDQELYEPFSEES